MKFTGLHKGISVALSLLVLFSTLSLTIKKHFCGDVLVDVAVFTKVDKCCDDDYTKDNIDLEDLKKTCCKDEIEVIDGVDRMATKSFDDLDDLQKQVLVAYAYSYINLLQGLQNFVIPHKDYSPPLIAKDIQVLNETYLI